MYGIIVEMFCGKMANFKILYSGRFFNFGLKVWGGEMGGQCFFKFISAVADF
jgi:hypothetical protein